jgi:hypothetical protein
MVRAIAIVLLTAMAGGPVAATACEARCPSHGGATADTTPPVPVAAAASEGTHEHHHHNHAAPVEARHREVLVVTAAVPGTSPRASLGAAVRFCCASVIAEPEVRLPVSSGATNLQSPPAALPSATPHVIADGAAVCRAGGGRQVPAPLSRPSSILRI